MKKRCRHTTWGFIGLLLTLFLSNSIPAIGQVDFEVYSDYGLSITKIQTPLEFGQVISGNTKRIGLGENGMAILEIKGVRYLDIFVDITAPTFLSHTGSTSNTFSFTLEAAYDNYVSDCISYSTARAQFINLSNNDGSARFRISGRTEAPPKPPPTPPHEGYTPPECSAFLFLYGEINVDDTDDAGSYDATITVNVQYD